MSAIQTQTENRPQQVQPTPAKPAVDDVLPAAGPHAKPHLTDEMKTPGAGTLPDPSRPQEMDSTG